MASTRLPGKVLAPVAGRPLLHYTLSACRALIDNGAIDDVVLCTTSDPEDDVLVRWAEAYSIPTVVRGRPYELWDWHLAAGRDRGWDYVMRVCADQPCLDVDLAARLSDRVSAEPGADYYGWRTPGNWPAVQTLYGLTTDVFWMHSAEKYDRAAARDKSLLPRDYREHTTTTFYRQPDVFACDWLEVPEEIAAAHVHATVDTRDDLERATRIVEYVESQFIFILRAAPVWELVAQWFRQNPDQQAQPPQFERKEYDGPLCRS